MITYGFAVFILLLCFVLWWRTPKHEIMARLLFRFGMMAALALVLMRYVLGFWLK